mgnify:CR=1 FL=1
MSGALGQAMEFNVELLRSNHFCVGVKRGNRYDNVDEDAVNNAVDLLDETVNRALRWCVWDLWWIERAMDEWLEARDRLEVRLRGRYGEEVVNDITGLVNKFISHDEQLWRYWHEAGNEVRKLVDDLLNGRAEVIIRGEDASGISVHEENVTLSVDKTSTGITVQLKLKGFKGVTIEVPDGFVENGMAGMETTQVWQVIAWTPPYPG